MRSLVCDRFAQSLAFRILRRAALLRRFCCGGFPAPTHSIRREGECREIARFGTAAFFLTGLLFCATPQGLFARDEQAVTWIFLNTGPIKANADGRTQEDITKMQMAHVGNFGKQFDAGKLLTAGPLGDNGFTRGIVVLAGSTPEQTAEAFKPDPFVQNRILSVEAHPWLIDVMRFGTPEVPFAITQHTLCVVKKGNNWKPTGTETNGDALLRLLPSLSAMARSGELALSGPFLDGGEKLGVMFFYSTNQAQLKAELAVEPALTDGRVELEFHPQYIGRGTLKNPAENLSPPAPGRTLALFDGKSFAGWEGETNHTWRVEKGALVGGSLAETVPHNDFLCTTSPYQNFILRLKVKLVGTGFVNGGIQLRSQRLKNPEYEMSGYQADMGEGYWGSLYDESRRNKTLAHANALVVRHTVRPEQWNDYVIRCDGPHIRLWLNGVVTADYHEAEKDIPQEGYIGLQIHGGGRAEASYRDISIEELPGQR